METKGIYLGDFDRRRRLTEAQRNEIRAKYATGQYSYRQLAIEYGVNTHTVQYTCNSALAEKHRALMRKNANKYRPSKDAQYVQSKKLRAYRKELFEAGKIK